MPEFTITGKGPHREVAQVVNPHRLSTSNVVTPMTNHGVLFIKSPSLNIPSLIWDKTRDNPRFMSSYFKM
jgi:hypothetical protein